MNTTTPSTGLGRVIDAQTLRMERLLDAPIQRVWSFLVDPDKRARWLAGGSCPTRSGDTIELRFENDALSGEKAPPALQAHAGVHRLCSRILAMEPPHRLVMTWQEGSEHASEVSFELAAQGERTQLVLVHTRLARRDEMLLVAGGWHTHLDLLDDVLADRAPRPFWTTFGARQQAYAPLIPAA